MADIFDQIHAKENAPSGGDIFDQIHSGSSPDATESHPLDSIGHGISEAWKKVNPIPQIEGMADAIRHPIDTAKAMGQQNADIWSKAKDAYSKGDYAGAVRHGVNYALSGIPGLGSGIEESQDKIQSGDLAGGLGSAIGTGVSLAAPSVVPKAVSAVAGGLKRAAVPIAESALGVKAIQRGYGKTPGQFALEETKGIRPSTVGASARDRLADLNTELENAAASSTTPASLQPARKVLSGRSLTAEKGNSAYSPAEIAQMEDALTKPQDRFGGATEYPAGANTPIKINPPTTSSGAVNPFGKPVVSKAGPSPDMVVSSDQSPSNILRMKREFGKDFTKWNPLHPKGEMGTARQAYRALDDELDRTVPGAQGLNQRISSGIPVAEQAESQALHAGPAQNVMHRVAAHTGAMALGAGAGYAAGGFPGMVAGTVIPELISTPAARMAGARGIYGLGKFATKPVVGKVAQAGAIAGPLLRKKDVEYDPLGLQQYIEPNQ